MAIIINIERQTGRIPAHGPGACDEICPAKTAISHPQNVHDTGLCGNIYHYNPQIDFGMTIMDWVCTSLPNGPFNRAECLIKDPFFYAKPNGPFNWPNETHPYTMGIRVFYIQKNIVPMDTTERFMKTLKNVENIVPSRNPNNTSPYRGTVLKGHNPNGTGAAGGSINNMIELLAKPEHPADWTDTINHGWGTSLPGQNRGTYQVGMSPPDNTIISMPRDNTVLLWANFVPTHIRIEFRSNCYGCGGSNPHGPNQWDKIHDFPLSPGFEFILEYLFVFDGFPRNEGPEVDGPQRDIGGTPTFDFKTPDDEDFNGETEGTKGPGRYFFPKDTIINNLKHNVITSPSDDDEGWRTDGWYDNYDQTPPWRFTNSDLGITNGQGITIERPWRLIALYKQNDNTAVSKSLFDANLDSVYPFSNTDGAYDKSILESLGIGWVPNPEGASGPVPIETKDYEQRNIIRNDGSNVTYTVWEYDEDGGSGPSGGRIQLPNPLHWDSNLGQERLHPTNGTMSRAGYIFHGWQDAKIDGRRYWGRGQHPGCQKSGFGHSSNCVMGCDACISFWASCPPANPPWYNPPCGGGPHPPPCGSGTQCPHCTIPGGTTMWARWERIVNIWRNRGTGWLLTAHTTQRVNSTTRDVNMLRKHLTDSNYVDPFGRYTNFPCPQRDNVNRFNLTPVNCQHCPTCCRSGNH